MWFPEMSISTLCHIQLKYSFQEITFNPFLTLFETITNLCISSAYFVFLNYCIIFVCTYFTIIVRETGLFSVPRWYYNKNIFMWLNWTLVVEKLILFVFIIVKCSDIYLLELLSKILTIILMLCNNTNDL